MAILGRILQKIFASTAGPTETGVIGSEDAGAPATSTNLTTIQSLAQYLEGMYGITGGGTGLPKLEDFNSIFLLITSQLKYLFQNGIPEWDAAEPYYAGISFVQEGGVIYQAVTGISGTPNLNLQPSTHFPTNWKTNDALVESVIYTPTLAASVAANALTIALKQKDGATNPGAGPARVAINFRSATAADGSVVTRNVTGALSLVIPSTATMGFSDAVADNIYVYAIDNAGTVELAVSTEALWDEGLLWDTTVLNTASDSRTVLYSTVARTAVPIRFLGRLRLTEATAGTWATAPSNYAGPDCDQSGVIQGTGNGVVLSSGVTADICSITIPPGKWDVDGLFGATPAATSSFTIIVGGTSKASATLPSGNFPTRDGDNLLRMPLVSPTIFNNVFHQGVPVPTNRLNLEVSTTIYMVISATFTVSTSTARGWIQARRVTK